MKVIGSENLEEEDQGSQITRFIDGYRSGRTEKKRISGPSFMGFLNSLIGVRTVYIIVFLVAVFMLIRNITNSEEYDVSQRKQRLSHDEESDTVPENEDGHSYRPEDKED
ncbi:disulfide isomerase-like 5-2 [Thalictrum thalictroides]|uniref:Disulfide isomerase-like 5-2 n=1 Tax=Thalictrum thalictroides TaxID=46969 RepID=A0A7J6WF36_THATH|nr:disulfide isomerase-like 5-2 [Thalictrum thalictroides]